MRFLSAAIAFVAAFTLAAAQTDSAPPQQPTQNPSADLDLRTSTPLGCFKSPGAMWDMGPYTYQSNGWCQALCVRQAATYFALVNGTNCFCGNNQPSSSFSASSSDCDTTCNGYSAQNCGGTNRWAVYADNFRSGDKTGSVQITTPTQTWFGHSATASSTLKTMTGPNTVVVTASSTASNDANSGSGGPNKAAIAGGVVVGLVGLAAIIGAAIFYFRMKKRRELDDERRRHDSIMRIVNPGEKPGSAFSGGSDARLEPSVMFQRRQSDGSIMDNQDYSRRILKVTNPDWRASRS